jgi:hypothetical protein
MMGTKERHFAPLINVSVEQLVPQDHFYRHVRRFGVCQISSVGGRGCEQDL